MVLVIIGAVIFAVRHFKIDVVGLGQALISRLRSSESPSAGGNFSPIPGAVSELGSGPFVKVCFMSNLIIEETRFLMNSSKTNCVFSKVIDTTYEYCTASHFLVISKHCSPTPLIRVLSRARVC